MEGSQTVESEQKNPLQEKIREYLNHKRGRWSDRAREIGIAIDDDRNRALFIEEWKRAIELALNTEELWQVMSMAFDPHQDMRRTGYLKSKIQSLRPELSNWYPSIARVPCPETSLNPEYDSVRKATGEKLRQLELTGHDGHTPKIFHLLLPSPYRDVVRETYEMKRVGKIFKRDVRVPVKEVGREEIRPYQELLSELFMPTESLPLPSAQSPKQPN